MYVFLIASFSIHITQSLPTYPRPSLILEMNINCVCYKLEKVNYETVFSGLLFRRSEFRITQLNFFLFVIIMVQSANQRSGLLHKSPVLLSKRSEIPFLLALIEGLI
jgi:hypothetical protein